MRQPASFRSTLLIRFFIAALLPVIFLGIFTYTYINRQISTEIAYKNQVIAQATAGQIASILTGPMTILAHTRRLMESVICRNQAEIQGALNQAIQSSPFFESVYILDRDKNISHLALHEEDSIKRENLIGLDMSGIDLFSDVPKEEMRLSKIYLSPLSGRKSIDIAMTLSGDRVLVGSFHIEHINDVLMGLSRKNDLDFFISDSVGNLVFHTRTSRVPDHVNVSNILPLQQAFKGDYGTYPFEMNLREYVGTTAAITPLKWHIVVAQPLDVAQKPLDRIRLFFGALLAVAVCLVGALALRTSAGLIHPLRKFKTNMDALADGRYKTGMPHQPLLELEEMAEVFRKMAGAIQSRERSLQVTAEESRKNEEKFRVIFERANDGILVADLGTGKIIMGNHRFAEMMGLEQEALKGMDIGAVFSEASDLEHLKRYGEKAAEGAVLFEQTISKRDGTRIFTEVNAARIEVEGADQFIGFFRDISLRVKAEEEKKALEGQLRQAHKMEAIGTLAGGIAHDFNNLLGIILGNLELAAEDLPQWTPVRKYLDEVATAGFRARDVVRQLLSFTRKSEQAKEPIHLSPVIQESVRLLRASIPSSVELEVHIETNLSPVNADPTQIQQIVINLCTNAVHAVSGPRGAIRIDLFQTRLSGETLKGFGALRAGPYVCLSVSDNGQGIYPDIMDRIFDPYFTTKEVGKGTGMGLSVVQGIVAGHDGALSLQSEPGEGTEVRIFLPAVEEAPAALPEFSPESIPTGKGNILLVDDEPSLLRAFTEIVEKLGYTAVPSTKPETALTIVREAPGHFDLVITDMTMPAMTGDALAEEISKIRQDLPVILCTGFSQEIGPDAPLPPGVVRVLEKPVDKGTLAKAIHELIPG